MEAEIGRNHCDDQIYQQQKQQQRQLFASKGYNFMSKGKHIMGDHEWDVNNWEWDSNLCIARPLSIDKGPGPRFQGKHLLADGPRPANGVSNDMYNQHGDAYNNGFQSYNTNDAAEKRRKVSVVEEEETAEEETAACLTLKLGGSDYPVAETDADGASGGSKNGKRSRGMPSSSHHHPMCQVDDCKADLNNAKDYHRRHKVCEMHAKANKALVSRLMQRFCQQCSRFHLLQEFDEGKRSCRRRLAGHNRRRRKTHPDGIIAGTGLNDERGSYSLIINLLKVLAQLQTSNNSDQASNQDAVLELLKKLASSATIPEETNAAAAKQSTADEPNNRVSLGDPSENTLHPLQNNFHVCNANAENKKTHDSVRPHDVQSSMPNISTIGSLSMGSLEPHSDVFRKSTDPSICEREQPFVSTQMRNYVLYSSDSAQKTVMSTVPQYSSNFWQRQEGIQQEHVLAGSVPQSLSMESTEKRRSTISNGFDLNNVYNAPEDLVPGSDGPSTVLLLGLDSISRQNAPLCSSWAAPDVYQTSPPQISDNSESGSDQSPSSSQGDGQDRTGRIVFKLFGKDPSEIPQVLRSQILDWLAHSPSDIESYIRPGCVILTIYLCLSEPIWQELTQGFKICLERLLGASNCDFWNTGWIFAQLDHQIAFIYDGQVLLDISSNFANAPLLLSVTPIAVTAGEKANIVVKGHNLTSSASKILCAFQGKHTVQEASTEYVQDVHVPFFDGSDNFEGCTQILCRSFSWSPENVIGRCFIEVEGHDMRGNFFPVIVAEEDVCAEIRTLERYIDMPFSSNQAVKKQNPDLQLKVQRQAIKFLHELGWLFQKSFLSQSNLGILSLTTFSPIRLKWLLEYATEQDWCSVVRKLLNILFSSNVNGANWSAITILAEVGILHIAVRRNCRAMVEFLLAYVPESVSEETMFTSRQGYEKLSSSNGFVLKPDMPGPAGLTPLHIAASMENAEGVLDALTNDPGQIGAKAWTNVRDKTGMTPEDYALLGGRHAYIQLVHKKREKNVIPEHVSLDIPELLSRERSSITTPVSTLCSNSQAGKSEGNVQGNKADLELCQKIRWSGGFRADQGKIKPLPSYCKLCDLQQLSRNRSTLLYRPAMLSMMAIATVCVCVTLIFKGPPQVLYLMHPFRWEVVEFGCI